MKETISYRLIFPVMLASVFLAFKPGLSQEVRVSNVRFSLVDSTVVVNYNLSGPKSRPYWVSLILRRKSFQGFKFIPIDVTGDVGRGDFEGNSRQIVWHLYSDFPDGLSGSDFYFQVSATLLDAGGDASWLYYVGGVILVGGAAAAVLYKSDLIGKSGAIPFPTPPGRP